MSFGWNERAVVKNRDAASRTERKDHMMTLPTTPKLFSASFVTASAFTGSFVSTASPSSTFSLISSSAWALRKVGDRRDAGRLSRLCCSTEARHAAACRRCEHAGDALALMQLLAEVLVWRRLVQVTVREAIVSAFDVGSVGSAAAVGTCVMGKLDAMHG